MSIRKIRCLFISPSHALIEPLETILRPHHYQLNHIASFAEAHALLAVLMFDFILVDSQLIITSDNLNALRQLTPLANAVNITPLIVLQTNPVQAEQVTQWAECESIFNIIEQQQLDQQLMTTLNYWRTHPPRKKLNCVTGVVLLDERVLNNLQKTASHLLPMFLMEFIQEIQIREQNLLHVETQEAWQQVVYEAHALKGVCANFGAKQLSELAAQIEQEARELTPKELSRLIEQVPPLAEQTIAATMVFLERLGTD